MLVLTRWFRRALVSGVCVAGLLGAGVVPALADPGDPPDPGIEERGPPPPPPFRVPLRPPLRSRRLRVRLRLSPACLRPPPRA